MYNLPKFDIESEKKGSSSAIVSERSTLGGGGVAPMSVCRLKKW